MSRKKLKDSELKVKLSIRINPKLFKIMGENIINKSKYIERLVFNDLLIKNNLDDNFEL